MAVISCTPVELMCANRQRHQVAVRDRNPFMNGSIIASPFRSGLGGPLFVRILPALWKLCSASSSSPPFQAR